MSYGGGNPRAWSSGGGGYSLSSRVKTWWRHQNYPVTWVILGVLVAVYLLQLITPLGVTRGFQFAGGYVLPGYSAVNGFEPWRMLTSVFLHSPTSVLHILLNGYALWIFGRQLEPILGRGRFIALFLIAGFGGSVAVLLFGSPLQTVVGASGAVFGLMGAFFVYLRTLGYNSPQLLFVLVANVVLTFVIGGISWQAHLGGLVTGAAIGWIYGNHRYPYQRAKGRTMMIGLVALLVAISVVRCFLPA